MGENIFSYSEICHHIFYLKSTNDFSRLYNTTVNQANLICNETNGSLKIHILQINVGILWRNDTKTKNWCLLVVTQGDCAAVLSLQCSEKESLLSLQAKIVAMACGYLLK